MWRRGNTAGVGHACVGAACASCCKLRPTWQPVTGTSDSDSGRLSGAAKPCGTSTALAARVARGRRR
eukprot:5218450-Alexandrium_andersonii.AAC.1